jgi:hypothetical protein
MAIRVCFIRTNPAHPGEFPGEALFIDHRSALLAICEWNDDSAWQYLPYACERVELTGPDHYVADSGQIVELISREGIQW